MNSNEQKVSALISILRALSNIPGLSFLRSIVREAEKAKRVHNDVKRVKKDIETLKK